MGMKVSLHLFISCLFATLLWHTLNVTFNLSPPTSISNLSENGLGGVNTKVQLHIQMGGCALLLAL